MSRVIFTGNTTKNLGVFYPAPYVQSIELNDNTYTVHSSIVLNDNPQVLYYDNGALETDDVALTNEAKNLHYYIMTFLVKNRAEDREPVEVFNEISQGNLNPLAFFAVSGSTINSQTNRDGDEIYNVSLFEISSPLESEAIEYYDEAGNRFLSHNSSTSFTVNWDDTKDLKFITFSSEIDYFSVEGDFVDEYEDKIDLLNYKVSEVSYETIYDDGQLGDPSNVVFIDSSDNIYEDVPLLDISITAHKIKNITHEQIVQRFQSLLDEPEYQRLYNAESGFNNLKTMMDNISVILQTKANDPGLLVALQRLISVFPDKTPTKPIGKFYKSFRKRVYTVNRAILDGDVLTKKIIYDSKITDLRSIEEGVVYDSSFVDGASEGDLTVYSTSTYSTQQVEFVPPSSIISYANQGMFQDFGNYSISCGALLFDYEKALRRSSNVARFIDVNKLETLGINVSWKNFTPVYAETVRRNRDQNVVARVSCVFDDQFNYPLSSRVYHHQNKQNGNEEDILIATPTDASPYLDSQPYISPQPSSGNRTTAYDANNGVASSLVFRQLLDPSNTDNGYGIDQSEIQDYRMMSFQLLDFRFDTNQEITSYDVNYNFNIYIEDRTVEILKILSDSFSSTLESLTDYLNTAQEDGAFNFLTNEFNNFFREGVTALYQDNPASAPWYVAPLVFALHRDLAYDSFDGNIDDIRKFGNEISQQINPTDGNPSKIEKLVEQMNALYQDFYANNILSSVAYDVGFDDNDDVVPRVCLYNRETTATEG